TGFDKAWILANRPPVLLTGRPEDNASSSVPTGNGVALLPPIVLGAPQVTSNQVTPSELAAAIQKIRDSDRRFQEMLPDVVGGVVSLRGMSQSWEDIFDFAERIAHVPGVERVILQDVRTPKDRRK